jgi:hypothetical protein
MFTNVLVVIAIVILVLIVRLLVVEVTEDVTRYFENKKLDKKLHNDWINKTGVYTYLKK